MQSWTSPDTVLFCLKNPFFEVFWFKVGKLEKNNRAASNRTEPLSKEEFLPRHAGNEARRGAGSDNLKCEITISILMKMFFNVFPESVVLAFLGVSRLGRGR